jgi:hypothetical protein
VKKEKRKKKIIASRVKLENQQCGCKNNLTLVEIQATESPVVREKKILY